VLDPEFPCCCPESDSVRRIVGETVVIADGNSQIETDGPVDSGH